MNAPKTMVVASMNVSTLLEAMYASAEMALCCMKMATIVKKVSPCSLHSGKVSYHKHYLNQNASCPILEASLCSQVPYQSGALKKPLLAEKLVRERKVRACFQQDPFLSQHSGRVGDLVTGSRVDETEEQENTFGSEGTGEVNGAQGNKMVSFTSWSVISAS